MKTFKFIAGSVIGAILFILIGEQADGRAPEPNDSKMVYKVGQYADLDWYLARWDAAGWKVPKDGETFTWKDYLTVVADGRDGDMVCYHESGEKKFACVEMIDEGKKDGKPGVIASIPLPSEGLINVFFVPRGKVDGFLRPIHKKGGTQVFGFPTKPPTNERAS